MTNYKFISDEASNNVRIDRFLAVNLSDITRSQVQSLCKNRLVLVNNIPVSKNYRLATNDVVTLSVLEENQIIIEPENLSLKVFYQDKYVAVIEKPKGMLVYPTNDCKLGTLANGLLYQFDKLSDLAGIHRPGIVHRLDKDTSGLMIIAFDNNTHKLLNEQMLNFQIIKKYQGIVYGCPKMLAGTINASIARNPVKRTQMAVVDGGRNAVTDYRVLAKYTYFSLLEYTLKTGRTHQIRVHSSYIGNPIAGDAIYGPRKIITQLKGQCLHAYQLEFAHPITEEFYKFESPLPDYFKKFITKIDS